jgi:hypothetical protein
VALHAAAHVPPDEPELEPAPELELELDPPPDPDPEELPLPETNVHSDVVVGFQPVAV